MAEKAPIDETEMTLVSIFTSGDIGAISLVSILLLLILTIFSVLIWKAIKQRRLITLINRINSVQNRKDVREVTMTLKKADGSYADQYQMETLTERLAEHEQKIEDQLSFG